MRTLWTDEVSEYDGELYQLPRCVQQPKPVQSPHPPIFFGGEGDPALRRVAEVGQGWLGAGVTPDAVSERTARLVTLLDEAGRTRADIKVYIMPNRAPSPDLWARYAQAGAEQLIFMVGGSDLDGYLKRLDKLADMAPNLSSAT
jgi:alkanesulfonate monooxygenase SsuD/methylene tetrahydromethanopterin reductase-like flavin-dependent oxidoreductase (luciferase family)